MTYDYIKVDLTGNVGTIMLDRPPSNWLNMAMMEEICSALKDFEAIGMKLLVFKAQGKAFSAGVEIAEHLGGLAERMIEVFHRMFRLMNQSGVPSIAFVDGAALGGGCELALSCDMVMASERAKFGQPEIQVGVFPPIAALILPRMIGLKKAMEFILGGKTITAKQALECGMINSVVTVDSFHEDSENYITQFKDMSGSIMKLARRAIIQGLNDDPAIALQKIEKIYIGELMRTHDAQEGLQAFLEKRKPAWVDR